MVQRRRAQRLGSRGAVLFQNMLLQRAAVHTDTDRDMPGTAGIRHSPDAVFSADIPGIDTDLVHPYSAHSRASR